MSSVLGSASSTSGGSSAPTVVFSPNVTSGSLLWIVVRFSSTTATVTSITDTRTSTWASCHALVRSNSASGQLWYAVAPSGGANTATVNLSASVSNSLDCAEISTTLTQLDQHNAAGANSAVPDSGNITTSATSVLFGGFAVTPNADAFTWDSGWTEQQPGGASTFRCSLATQMDVAAGTYKASGSISIEDWVAMIASFVAPTVAQNPYSRTQLNSLLAA